MTSLSFYPYDDGAIEYAAPQTLERHAGSIDLAMKLGYQPPKSGPVRGVLLATEQSGSDTITVPIEIAAPLAAGAPGALAAAAAAALRACQAGGRAARIRPLCPC